MANEWKELAQKFKAEADANIRGGRTFAKEAASYIKELEATEVELSSLRSDLRSWKRLAECLAFALFLVVGFLVYNGLGKDLLG